MESFFFLPSIVLHPELEMDGGVILSSLCLFLTLVHMCMQRHEVDIRGLPSLLISVESGACSYRPLGTARLLQDSALTFVPPNYMWPATPTQHVQGFWGSELRKCRLSMMVHT